MDKPIGIGILGCGTVGAGVAKILLKEAKLIRARVGRDLNLAKVADVDTETDRGIAFGPGVFVPDAFSVVADPDIDIVVETIGGQTIAKDLIMAAIEAGKHVVTANKALLAAQGGVIFKAAEKKGVDVAYEASVGGCMPVIKTIRESLVGNEILSMTGILNGTCNYIFTRIAEEGIPFESALAEAQAKGYAEAVPTLDIEGLDTAHKLTILASLAYGVNVELKDVYTEGISRITPLDLEYARQFGYTIKLLAIAKYRGQKVEARVHPTMIPLDNPLANVLGTLNAITLSTSAAGDIMLYGHGAGQMPTASAVVSDLGDLARNMACKCPCRVPALSFQPDRIQSARIRPMAEIQTHYYCRIFVADRPGVLSRISGILGQAGISIKSVHQKGRRTEGPVPIIMLTHLAKEADMKRAMKTIADLDMVAAEPMLIRIEDENGTDSD